MKTKFLYVCSDDWDILPTEEDLKSKLHCKQVIELSDDNEEMLKRSKNTRYKAGPLTNIFFTICSHRTYYFSIAWGIDISNHYSRRNRKIFLISDDVEHKFLTSLMMTVPYKARAFTLSEDGIDPINSYIESYVVLNDSFQRDYENYKSKRDSVISIMKNISSKIDEKYFEDLSKQELDFLNLCNKQADVYMSKIGDALSNGWS